MIKNVTEYRDYFQNNIEKINSFYEKYNLSKDDYFYKKTIEKNQTGIDNLNSVINTESLANLNNNEEALTDLKRWSNEYQIIKNQNKSDNLKNQKEEKIKND